MAKKLILGLILIYLSWILPLIDVRYCCKLSFQGKLMIQTWEIDKKTSVWACFRPVEPKFRLKNKWFFFRNLASSVTRYHGMLSSYTRLEKTNNPFLRKLSDGPDRRTDGQTVRQTDKSYFKGSCQTNVENPIDR